MSKFCFLIWIGVFAWADSHMYEQGTADLESLESVVNPHKANVSEVKYYLWTSQNQEDDDFYNLIPEDITNILNSSFNGELHTHILVHGYNNWGRSSFVLDSKNALLQHYDCNVISIDWELLANSLNYAVAVANVYPVANRSAYMVDRLVEHMGLSTDDLHVTGWSLGAHTAGLTAKYVTSGTVRRVTGLDPAGPLFYDVTTDERIDKSDAKFVDIIHTNSGPFLQGCFGLFENVGHVDFYVNGGTHQPGCVPQIFENFTIIDAISDCSHERAPDVWIESIRADGADSTYFMAWPCEDWGHFTAGECQSCASGCLNMGMYVNESATGKYYLRTSDTSPFALGEDQGSDHDH